MAEFQTRGKDGDIRFFPTLAEAMAYAKSHKDVWKVSFSHPETGERIRLVADGRFWNYEPIEIP